MSPLRRREKRTQRIPLGFLNIYLDDVDTIEKVLRAQAEEVEIRVGDLIADTAEDLKSSARKNWKNLEIRSNAPSVTVTLARFQANISATGPEGLAIANELASILKQNRSLMPAWPFWLSVPLAPLIAVMFWIMFHAVIPTLGVVVISALIPMAVGNAILAGGGVLFHPETKDAFRKTFRDRRRDFLFTLLGALVGAIVTKLLD